MPRNPAGVYSPPNNSWNPAIDGTDIDASDWAALLADLSDALTGSVTPAQLATTVAAGYLPLTGGTLTGDLTINKASPTVALNATGATEGAAIAFRRQGFTRWSAGLDDAAGAGFALDRFNGAGAYLGTPVFIDNASGNVTLANTLTVGGTATVSGGFNSVGITNLQGSYTAVYANLTVGTNGGGFVPVLNGAHIRGVAADTSVRIETQGGGQPNIQMLRGGVRDWIHGVASNGNLYWSDITGGGERMRIQAADGAVVTTGSVYVSGSQLQCAGQINAYNDFSFRMGRSGAVSYFQATADDWMQFNDSASNWDLVLAGASRLNVGPTTMSWSPAGHTFMIDGIFHFRTFPTAGLPSAAVYSPTWVARTSAPGDWAATNDGATWQLMHFV